MTGRTLRARQKLEPNGHQKLGLVPDGPRAQELLAWAVSAEANRLPEVAGLIQEAIPYCDPVEFTARYETLERLAVLPCHAASFVDYYARELRHYAFGVLLDTKLFYDRFDKQKAGVEAFNAQEVDEPLKNLEDKHREALERCERLRQGCLTRLFIAREQAAEANEWPVMPPVAVIPDLDSKEQAQSKGEVLGQVPRVRWGAVRHWAARVADWAFKAGIGSVVGLAVCSNMGLVHITSLWTDPPAYILYTSFLGLALSAFGGEGVEGVCILATAHRPGDRQPLGRWLRYAAPAGLLLVLIVLETALNYRGLIQSDSLALALQKLATGQTGPAESHSGAIWTTAYVSVAYFATMAVRGCRRGEQEAQAKENLLRTAVTSAQSAQLPAALARGGLLAAIEQELVDLDRERTRLCEQDSAERERIAGRRLPVPDRIDPSDAEAILRMRRDLADRVDECERRFLEIQCRLEGSFRIVNDSAPELHVDRSGGRP